MTVPNRQPVMVLRFALVVLCASVVTSISVSAHGVDKKNTDSQRMESLLSAAGRLNENWKYSLPVGLEMGMGYLSGQGTITDKGPMFKFSGDISSNFEYKKIYRLGLTLDTNQRETIGFSLTDRHVIGEIKNRITPVKGLELGLTADAGWRSKPNWPDPYQPELDSSGLRTGRLLPTDRYSYFNTSVETYGKKRLKKRFYLELYGSFSYHDNVDDPNYDGRYDPTHLVPGDRWRLRSGVSHSGSVFSKIWRYKFDFRTDWINYQNTYSRDAKTGKTHAAPGGEPANPLQEFVRFRLRTRNSFKIIPNRLKLILAGDYTYNKDTFEDYFTWNQVQGDVNLDLAFEDRFFVNAGYALEYRLYTKNGYQETESHPPLNNGDSVRKNIVQKINARAEVSVLFSNFRFFAQGSWEHHETNFPNYRPGEFPSQSQYWIDWDYVNFSVVAGICIVP